MFPYQITQALADQHIRDLQTDARRHRQAAEARLAGANAANAANATNASSRLTLAVAHLRAPVLGHQGADTRSTAATISTTSQTSGAGPMGCIA